MIRYHRSPGVRSQRTFLSILRCSVLDIRKGTRRSQQKNDATLCSPLHYCSLFGVLLQRYSARKSTAKRNPRNKRRPNIQIFVPQDRRTSGMQNGPGSAGSLRGCPPMLRGQTGGQRRQPPGQMRMDPRLHTHGLLPSRASATP
ncbi:hypothetical protein TNCV_1215861 [Trichonephila clavipes]|nr:hypothetical protein TNCV_1215861 [Trichonephila clavipes]